MTATELHELVKDILDATDGPGWLEEFYFAIYPPNKKRWVIRGMAIPITHAEDTIAGHLRRWLEGPERLVSCCKGATGYGVIVDFQDKGFDHKSHLAALVAAVAWVIKEKK